MRVAQFLSERQVAFETIVHAPAFSAQKRAKYLHVPGSQVAKCVLLAGPAGYVLAVLPSTCRVELEALVAYLQGPVRVAQTEEVASIFRDCEWGVAAPFGRLYGLPTILDAGLDPDTLLVFETHTHAEAIRMSVRDFERLEHPVRVRFARP
jgi:Ala-tRNA(Pro) deacylase